MPPPAPLPSSPHLLPPPSALTISIDCTHACCSSLLRLLTSSPSTGGAANLSMQHEFIVAELVAAWRHLPRSTRIDLLPVFVHVRLSHRRALPAAAQSPLQALTGCESYLSAWAMGMCKDAWLTDALSLSPPCLFFAPPLVDVSKAASSLTVEARTPFLVAVLDALNAALSRACMTGRASDGGALAAVAVDALEKLWHTASWSEAACYAYVAALSSAVAAESKRLGAEFEQSSGGSSLQAIMLKLLEHMNTLSSPAAMTRALLLLAIYIPIKRNVEANVTAITRHIFDRMCHAQPAGQEGVSDAAVLLPALARLGSRSPEAHAAVCAEVKQRLNHELQASGSTHSTYTHTHTHMYMFTVP